MVLYDGRVAYVGAVRDYVDSFRRYSAFAVSYCHVGDVSRVHLGDFDAVWVNYCCRLWDVPVKWDVARRLKEYGGVKAVSLQDEYDFTHLKIRGVEDLGARVVVTCVPVDHAAGFYPTARVEQVLTGYVSEDLLQQRSLPLAGRPIVVGYRGRELPYRLGDLGWHKAEVGRRFAAACARRSIPSDIGWTEGARLYGPRWVEFIRSCRVMLGCESGSSTFDHDGSLHNEVVRRWYEVDGGVPYEDVRDFVMSYKTDFAVGQISPRIFEAVACRTALALVRGDYSGRIRPDEHYVPIEPDYSNVDAVLDQVQDVDAMQRMADRAYDHVVGNPDNHYAAFVRRVDELLMDELDDK